jgi:hypothetical protein
MKCPNCTTTQKRKEGMKCNKCGYQHVFDPKTDGITDGKFMALLKGASANDTYYFTYNQLYARYCQGRSNIVAAIVESSFGLLGWLGLLAVAGGALGFLIGAVLEEPFIIAPGLLVALIGVVLAIVGRNSRQIAPARTLAPDEAKLRGWVMQWERAGRPIARLLRAPSLDRPPQPYREDDIYDYGVERLIIVDQDLIVDLFVKNNLHAEQRALVLSERGYPTYLLPHAQRLLAERPDLPVILFHDSTQQGAAMAGRLQSSSIFPLGGRRLVDAGLFPNDVPKIASIRSTIPSARGNAVPADFLPFGAMAAGLAGVAGGGLLMSAALAGAAQPPHPDPARQQGASSSSDSGGGGGAADFGGEGDFGGDGDGDFG